MKGRNKCFQCIYCGKYTSYDMRKTGKEYSEKHIFDRRDESYDLDWELLFYHKKCKPKGEQK